MKSNQLNITCKQKCNLMWDLVYEEKLKMSNLPVFKLQQNKTFLKKLTFI